MWNLSQRRVGRNDDGHNGIKKPGFWQKPGLLRDGHAYIEKPGLWQKPGF